jgi:phosphonopyruvate decarboxylase
MHMGALAAIAVLKPANLRHIILNNGAHDSVGGQPTIALNIDILGIAAASGYKHVFSAANLEELRRLLGQADNTKGRKGHLFIEVKVRKGARKDLGRPRSSPQKNKKALMDAINSFQNKE